MYDKVSGRLFGNAGTGAFIIGPDKYTARDYVQDGLVAMWDAIDNVGLGSSDHSTGQVNQIVPNGPQMTILNVTFDETTSSFSTSQAANYTTTDESVCSPFVNRSCTIESIRVD